MTDKGTLSTTIVDALGAWSNVEFALARLFSILADIQNVSDPKLNQKAYAIFDAIISFDARLDIVSALMGQEGITELELETWTRVSARLRKLYKRRHGLAHFTISAAPPTQTDPSDQSTWDYGILPFFTLTSVMKNGIDPLPFDQIVERRRHFEEIAGAIWYYVSWATQRREPLQGTPMPEPLILAQLRASASQSLQERAHKPPPSPERCD